MAKAKYRHLSIPEAAASGAQIWCLNNTVNSMPSLREIGGGEVIIQVNHPGGSSSALRIPATTIPWELTALVPRDDLLAAPRFFEAITKRTIVLISQDDALDMLSDPELQAEAQRLKNVDAKRKAEQMAGGLEGEAPKYGPQGAKGIGLDDDEGTRLTAVSRTFKGFIAEINGLEPEDARGRVISRGEMTLDEAKYLVQHCQHTDLVKRVSAKMGSST